MVHSSKPSSVATHQVVHQLGRPKIFSHVRLRRYGFITMIVLSVIELGISAALTQLSFSIAPSNGIGIACAVLTISILIIVPVCEQFGGQNPFTSWTAIELSWMLTLTVFWLVNATFYLSNTELMCRGTCWADWLVEFEGLGSNGACSDWSRTTCREYAASSAFSWINAGIVLAQFIWTLVILIRALKRGDKFIWHTSPATYQFARVLYRRGSAGQPLTGRQAPWGKQPPEYNPAADVELDIKDIKKPDPAHQV